MFQDSAPRSALLAGATGLVGRDLLAALLADPRYAVVHTLGRRPPARQDARLRHHLVDFGGLGDTLPAGLSDRPRIDEVYIALGTTIKTAGSRQALRAVDYDAVIAVARLGLALGAQRIGVVSALGANARSSVFYSRVKGEMEETVRALGYASIVFARPSLLAGDRASLGQSVRRGEIMGMAISRALRPLIPAGYRSISSLDVAHALLQAVQQARPGPRVLGSAEMQGAASR